MSFNQPPRLIWMQQKLILRCIDPKRLLLQNIKIIYVKYQLTSCKISHYQVNIKKKKKSWVLQIQTRKKPKNLTGQAWTTHTGGSVSMKCLWQLWNCHSRFYFISLRNRFYWDKHTFSEVSALKLEDYLGNFLNTRYSFTVQSTVSVSISLVVRDIWQ